MKALFSGRFDQIHLGHVISIMRLSDQFDEVLVVILDYPERAFPVEYVRTVLSEALSHCKGVFQVFTNNTHFAKITTKELEEWDFDVYCSGNMEVLNHIRTQGKKIQYVERAYEYEASADRYARDVKNFFNSMQKKY